MTQKTYIIDTTETTTIIINNYILKDIDSILKENSYSMFLLLCDDTTKKLFINKVLESLKKLGKPIEIHSLTPGEDSKNTINLFRILEHMVEKGFDRKSAVIALGGGVIGDIATIAAGVFLRGIDCIQIPTTLLAQVDAAIGGKGAVNVRHYKNIIGVIKQPSFILIDPMLLTKLPEKQYKSGIGEVLKYAIAMDKKLFELLEKQTKHTSLLPIINRCVELKTNIVQKDPHEKSGKRQQLNFGHTLGHAIELYAHLSHGEAISIGMTFAIIVSEKLNMLKKEDAKKSIELLKVYKLPTTISKKSIAKDTIYTQMKKDKKAIDGMPTFVLLEGIGKTKSGCHVQRDIIEQTLDEILI
ncbi:MAG: 3-dehydroquinate synthase [Candidatus Levyibacteriota bacterium]|nr:MAG: 3-dehydroquinate synthase [Candidatus Levybacteria bacterium]